MEKKYQFFISSTYEDLKKEREKAIFTILEMEQFPVGMELFSAADEEQWSVIRQTIDTSDYYVLIIGRRYGSTITECEDEGISYTEKEFNYAVCKGIPVLAFIMEESTVASIPSTESSEALAKLREFKDKVKTGRYVKWFKNEDQFATYLSQSIHKALKRGDRPGWVRATEFNIEESHARILQLTERIHVLEKLNSDLKLQNDRKPELLITYSVDPESFEDGKPIGNEPEIVDGVVKFKVKSVYMDDAKEGVEYNSSFGRKMKVEANDVRLLRHFFQNGFTLLFHVINNGTLRATGVRVHMDIPDGLLVASNQNIWEYMDEPVINYSHEEYDGRMKILFAPDEYIGGIDDGAEDRFISIDELICNEDIADLLDPGELDVSPGEIDLEFNEVKHKDSQFYRGAYILPTKLGEYEIKCSILCNELAEATEQMIKLVID